MGEENRPVDYPEVQAKAYQKSLKGKGKNIILGMTGTSGAIYGLRTLRALLDLGAIVVDHQTRSTRRAAPTRHSYAGACWAGASACGDGACCGVPVGRGARGISLGELLGEVG